MLRGLSEISGGFPFGLARRHPASLAREFEASKKGIAFLVKVHGAESTITGLVFGTFSEMIFLCPVHSI